MSRTNRSIQNIIFSFGLQAITIFTNFVIRTFMIRNLGLQATSINGLFTEVLAALSLAELGIGSAIVYNLYGPLAEGDYNKVCQLMGLYKRAYQIISLVTFGIGLLLCPWIHILVNSVDYSMGYLRLVYMLFVTDLAMSYLLTYKVSLMYADQTNYIQSKIGSIIKIFEAIIKIVVLISIKNYVFFLVISITMTLCGNVIRSKVVDKYYPWLKKNNQMLPKEERKEVFENIKNIFIKSLSGKITNSTDNILISVLVNTIQVGIYSNYSLIMGVFRQVANQIAYGGLEASLGNLLVTESKERCQQVFYRLVYLFYIIGAVSCSAIYNCIAPAIMLWLKSEELLLAESIVFICCLNLFIEIINRPLWSIMEVSGLFKYDKYVSIAGSVVNLVVSIVLGMKIGIVGIFIGTFLTWFIQAVLKAKLLFQKKLETSPGKYYLIMAGMFGLTLAQLVLSAFICSKIIIESHVLAFVVYGIISVIITGATTILFTFRSEPFGYYMGLVQNVIGLKRKRG